MPHSVSAGLALAAALAVACTAPVDAPPDPAEGCRDDARSPCAAPTQPPAHYVEQAERYFDSLDGSADPASVPGYAERVARWEWPPWLKLTGYGRDLVPAADRLVLLAFPDTTVPERDCRAFDTAPFARCHVVMRIDGRDCPIYEELTFDPAGDVSWVEAWSDLPGLGPADDDAWGDADSVHRLSTRIPGLGSASGRIDPASDAMTAAAAEDADVADFAARAQDFWGTWSAELAAAGDDLYARGCGWDDAPAAARAR